MASHQRVALVASLALTLSAYGCSNKPPEPPPSPQPTTTRRSAPAPAATEPTHPSDCTIVPHEDNPPGQHDRYAFTGETGLVGYKDRSGAVVIPPKFTSAHEFSKFGVAAAIMATPVRPVFIDTEGLVVADAYTFDNEPDPFVNGLARIVEDGKVGFIDRRGNTVIDPQFDNASSFCSGRAWVCRGCPLEYERTHGPYGFIDRTGKLVIPYRYDEANVFHTDGRARVRDGNCLLDIDTDGAVIRTTRTANRPCTDR